jgi:AraC family transcriptional regulator of adaptative response/methylated-DNA-[protein]-cysteine methyltransferase
VTTRRSRAIARQVFAEREGKIVLAPVGTNFQVKVWQALLELGTRGPTSYGALADAIGSPGASRAVGPGRRARIRSPGSFPATACCAATAGSAAITGASSASARCSRGSMQRSRARAEREFKSPL